MHPLFSLALSSLKTAAHCAIGLAFSLACLGSPLTFTFDTGPDLYFDGADVLWSSEGGNPGGFVRNSITSNYTENRLNGCGLPTCLFGDGTDLLNLTRIQMFDPTDIGVVISFDYRVSVVFQNLTFTAPPTLILEFSDSVPPPTGVPVIMIARLPLVNDGTSWTHVELPLTSQNFSRLPTNPALLQYPLRLALLSQYTFRAAGPGPASFAETFDLDNLTLGHPTPEPSTMLPLALALSLVAFKVRRRRRASPVRRLPQLHRPDRLRIPRTEDPGGHHAPAHLAHAIQP